ncbi:MAG: filamentous hemagglutinin N-terminal domain-containing protein [Leptolyngbyaceae cyanobacterium]
MNTRALPPVRGLLCVAVVGTVYFPLPGLAQDVIPDDTLGAESSIVTPLDANTDRIDGGALRDAVLFHSFEGFSIPQGHEVYFANPELVNTIFSRVTGDDPSRLFGTLGVLGEADLLFLNPNGVLFGPNAELDLQGAFTVTTGTGVVFPGGEVFSAVEPGAVPLLTVDVQPQVGVVFEGETPAAIVNQGNLTVDSGQSLVLVGGALANSGTLYAPGGQVSVAAAPGNHEVQFEPTGTVQSWSALAGEPLAYEGLSIEALVNSSGLDLATLPAEPSVFEPGTTVVSGRIDASSDVSEGGAIQVLGDRVALVDAIVEASGAVGGGEVFIGGDYQGQGVLPTASRTFIGSEVLITADALQEGNGGRVIVWADGNTEFLGNITVRGGAITGDGGFVEVSGSEDLRFLGNVNTQAINGDGGTVLLDPRDITIVNGSGGNNDGELADAIIFASDSPDNDFTISEEALEFLSTQTNNILLRARRNITIENLSDNELTIARNPGANLTFEANFDPSQSGSFSMDVSDRIAAQQWNVNILGDEVSIGTIGVSAFAFPNQIENAGSITINALDDIKVLGATNIAADPNRHLQQTNYAANSIEKHLFS